MVAEDAPLPPIMQVISDAYHIAQQRRYLSFVITEVPDQVSDGEPGDDHAPGNGGKVSADKGVSVTMPTA
jgi:hypothetical protein